MSSQWIILYLSVGGVLINIAAACRAFYMAYKIESECDWLCNIEKPKFGEYILVGFGTVCLMFAFIKAWVIFDAYDLTWIERSSAYQQRAFAHLTYNYGFAIIAWKVTTLIHLMSLCDGHGGRKK